MCLTNHIRNVDGNYGPTLNGNVYSSKPDHRMHSKSKKEHKTKWCIKEGQEYEVFRRADEVDPGNPDDFRWFCGTHKCLFSIINGGKKILGQGKERIAKFIMPPNPEETCVSYPHIELLNCRI